MKRFVVDRHLGHLARWLRTLGYDAFFQVDASLDRIRSEAAQAETILVTTESSAAEKTGAPAVLVVPKADLRRQLRAIQACLPEPVSQRMFTRCVLCNVPVLPVAKKSIENRVPEAVRARTQAFTICPSCGRIYWEGTHTARLRSRLAFLLHEDDDHTEK